MSRDDQGGLVQLGKYGAHSKDRARTDEHPYSPGYFATGRSVGRTNGGREGEIQRF